MRNLVTAAIFLLAVCLGGNTAWGQTLDDYVFSTGTSGTLYSPSWTNIITSGNDDAASAVQNIGFTFTYDGESYTQFSANSNGNLRLGSTANSSGSYSIPFGSGNYNANEPKIIGIGRDMSTGAAGYVRTGLYGSNGSYVRVIEFKLNTGYSSSGTTYVVFQIQLFQANNEVRIVYSSDYNNTPSSYQIGIGNATYNRFWYVNPNNHTATYSTTYTSTTYSVWPGGGRYYSFVPVLPSCPRPSGLTIASLTSNSATVSWTAGGSETSWVVEYSTASDFTGATSVNVSGTPSTTLSGLSSNTTYYVRVKANCGGGNESGWQPTSFMTAIGVPFCEEFNTSSRPTDWNNYSGLLSSVLTGTALTSNTSYWSYGTSNGAFNGSSHARINIYGTSVRHWLVTPAIYLNGNSQLEFDLSLTAYSGTLAAPATTGTDDKFVVLVSTDNMTTWTILRQWDNSGSAYVYNNINATATGESVIIDLSTYTGQTVHIGFYGESTTSNADNNLHIDNVCLEPRSACLKPSGLTVSAVTENSATVSWTETGTASSWTIQYSTSSDFSGATSVTVTSNPYMLTGLNASTHYYVRVRANCGGANGNSDWTAGVDFTTTAVATVVGTEWCDNFEGASCGWERFNGNITNAWAWGTATNNGGTHSIYISNDGGTSNAYSIGSSSMVYATKLLTFATGEYEFSYDWKAYGESEYNDYLRVALVPAPATFTAGTATPTGFGTTSLPTGWTALDGGSRLNLVSTWQTKSVTIDVVAGNYYMVLSWYNDGSVGTAPPAAVDNVCVRKQSCPRPTGLVISGSGQSATVTWTAGDGTQWNVAHATSSAANPSSNIVATVNATTYTMDNLTIDADHYFWVRRDCGGGNYSSWVGPVSVHVGYCNPAPTSVDNNGITNVTLTGSNTVTNTTHPTSSPYYGNYTARIVEAESGGMVTVAITYATSYTYNTYIWVDWNNNLNFESDEIVCSGESTSTNPTTLTLTFTVPTAQAGGDYRLRIGGADSGMPNTGSANPCYSSTYGIFEDYTLQVLPSCQSPTGVTVTNITTETATVNWSGSASGYNVRYRKFGVYVQEGFESGIPATWTTIDADGDGNNWLAISQIPTIYPYYTMDLSNWAHNGNNSATSPSAYNNTEGGYDPLTTDHWLITPQFELGGRVKFYAASADPNYYDDYEVLLSTTGTAPANFNVTLKTMSTAPYHDDSWEEVNIDLSSYAGQSGYIAIHHVSNDMYFLLVDDVEIDTVGEWTNLTTTSNSMELSGLDAGVTYEVQVQSDCGGGETSVWSSPEFFTTSCPIYRETFESGATGWEFANGTIANKWVRGSATSNGGSYSVYISNDGGTSNAYTNNSSAMVYAYKSFNLAGGRYQISYDWKNNGESSFDFLRVAMVPATEVLNAATDMPTDFSYNTLPSGWIALDGGSQLYQSSIWQKVANTIDVPAGNYNLVFAWSNDGSVGADPPAAFDNVEVRKISTIPKPTISGTTPVCYGNQTTLSTGDFASYNWSTGATTQSITPTPTSNTDYTVTVTDADGCEVTSPAFTVAVDRLDATIQISNP